MSSMRDHAGRPIVVVTGAGVITSLGVGKADNWAKLSAGQSGIRAITRFSTEALRTRIAGTVEGFSTEPFCMPEAVQRAAESVVEEAVAESAIGVRGDFPGPLFIAMPPIEFEWPHRFEMAAEARTNDGCSYDDLLRLAGRGGYRQYHARYMISSVADGLAEKFGTKGSPVTLTTACASGASAIQLGVEAIRRGETDAALCVGADVSVTPEALIRFSLLSALSTANDEPSQAARPFSKDRDGFVMAEGAAALVLESLESASARGADILGVVEGCGDKADSFHLTRSSPDGHATIGCVRQAIADAGLVPEQIDYINAHGTGTPENDKMEGLSASAVFGERAKDIPISSNKSMIGHTLSAAGAVEAVFTLLTMRHQRIPPTINYRVPDPALPFDVVPNVARNARVRHAISNSFGFGGQNVTLALGLEPT